MATQSTPLARSGSARTGAQPSRLVIDRVHPCVDGGRFAVKRLVGDTLVVEAIVYRDGHDLLTGRVRVRSPEDRRWHSVRATYEIDLDLLRAEVVLDRVGAWSFTVEAWTDRFGTWQADFAKRVHSANSFWPFEIAFEGNDTTQPRTMLREVQLRVGDPVLTLFAEGADEAAALNGLLRRAEEVGL